MGLSMWLTTHFIHQVVIVLSRSYVESKWCQFELHLSQHRLLESERRDALVLILLEDVPKQQQNAGLRYLLTTRTYLAWRNDLEGQRLFWQRLRQVLTVRHHKDSSTSSHQSVTLRVSTWGGLLEIFLYLVVLYDKVANDIEVDTKLPHHPYLFILVGVQLQSGKKLHAFR